MIYYRIEYNNQNQFRAYSAEVGVDFLELLLFMAKKTYLCKNYRQISSTIFSRRYVTIYLVLRMMVAKEITEIDYLMNCSEER
jgi:hypothetical protein